jgi:hypothetical protein
MKPKHLLHKLVYIVMKLGLVVFLFPFFWEYIRVREIGPTPVVSTGRIILLFLYIAICFFIFILREDNFDFFGFLIVLIASIYMLISIFILQGWHDGLAVYFFLVCISFYFVTKVNRARLKNPMDD